MRNILNGTQVRKMKAFKRTLQRQEDEALIERTEERFFVLEQPAADSPLEAWRVAARVNERDSAGTKQRRLALSDENRARFVLARGINSVERRPGEPARREGDGMQKTAMKAVRDRSLVRKMMPVEVKQVEGEDRTIRIIITAMKVDRDGDVVVASGGKVDAFLKNAGIVLFSHMPFFPVANAMELILRQEVMEAKLKFFEADESGLAERLYKLYSRGKMRAASIGFIPIEISEDPILEGQTGRTFLEWELLEFSLVAIPSLREALSLEESMAAYRKFFSLTDAVNENLEEIFADPEKHLDDIDPGSGKKESSGKEEKGSLIDPPIGPWKWYAWTRPEAVQWLKDNDGKVDGFTEEKNFFSFTQETGNFTAIRTKWIGPKNKPDGFDPQRPKSRPIKTLLGIRDGKSVTINFSFYHGRGDIADRREFESSGYEDIGKFLVVTKFSGSPRNPFGSHASFRFKGGQSGYKAAWLCHFSQINGGALTPRASGPIRGTVRRIAMIAAAMRPACLVVAAEGLEARTGPKSPLKCTFPEKPSDYGLSRWLDPIEEDVDPPSKAVAFTCDDLNLIKRAAVGEIKRRIKDREEAENASGKSVSGWWEVASAGEIDTLTDGGEIEIKDIDSLDGDSAPPACHTCASSDATEGSIEAKQFPTNARGLTVQDTLRTVESMDRQFTQAEAGFRQPSEDSAQTCGACRFYLRDPSGGTVGTCSVVQGPIPWFGKSDLYISATAEAAAIFAVQDDARSDGGHVYVQDKDGVGAKTGRVISEKNMGKLRQAGTLVGEVIESEERRRGEDDGKDECMQQLKAEAEGVLEAMQLEELAQEARKFGRKGGGMDET